MQMLDATCDINYLMEMVDKIATKEMINDFSPGYGIELFFNS